MTTVINGTTLTLYANKPATIDLNQSIVITSQYSQTVALTITTGNWTTAIDNDRYVQIEATIPATFKDEHQNGYYTWTIGNYSDIVKIITSPGGGPGEVEYISSNENREADVYFRPNY